MRHAHENMRVRVRLLTVFDEHSHDPIFLSYYYFIPPFWPPFPPNPSISHSIYTIDDLVLLFGKLLFFFLCSGVTGIG